MQQETDPDTSWVASLAGVSAARADRALGEARKETRLFGYLDRMHHAGGRSFYIEIEAPLELYALTRLLRPRHVVEVGVSSGVSSAYFLQGLERNGRGTLHSVDLPQEDRRRPDLRKNRPPRAPEAVGPAPRRQEGGAPAAGRRAGEDRPLPVRCPPFRPGGVSRVSLDGSSLPRRLGRNGGPWWFSGGLPKSPTVGPGTRRNSGTEIRLRPVWIS
jgi:hypothetical protein